MQKMKFDNIGITKTSIIILNFIIMLFLSFIIYFGIDNICENDNAREFIENIPVLPFAPYLIPVFTVILFSLFIFISSYKPLNNMKLYDILFFLDIVIVLSIIYLLHMSYSGVILLIAINVMMQIESGLKKSIYLIILFFFYIFADYGLISSQFRVISINDYIEYFNPLQKTYIYAVLSFVSSLNQVLFAIFLILSVQKQIQEKLEIRKLYNKLKETTDELTVANIQLENYSKLSEEMAKAKERNRLAMDIHDTVGHAMTGIVTGVEACIILLETNTKAAREQLSKIHDMAKRGLLDIRQSVRALKPDILEKQPFVAAIKTMINEINTLTSTHIDFVTKGTLAAINTDIEENIFRIIQESISNSIRHGKAKNISIDIEVKNSSLNLIISDDGHGTENPSEGFGLKTMRERVSKYNGSISYEINSIGGFTINIKLDLKYFKEIF